MGSAPPQAEAETASAVAEPVILTPPGAVQPPAFVQLPPAQYYLELQAWSKSVEGQQQAALPPHLANGPRPEIDPANYAALKARCADLEAENARLVDRLCDGLLEPLPAESSPAWSDATLFDRLVVELLGLDHPDPAAGMSREDWATESAQVAINIAHYAHEALTRESLSSAYSPAPELG
jgi:hypothetical protein